MKSEVGFMNSAQAGSPERHDSVQYEEECPNESLDGSEMQIRQIHMHIENESLRLLSGALARCVCMLALLLLAIASGSRDPPSLEHWMCSSY